MTECLVEVVEHLCLADVALPHIRGFWREGSRSEKVIGGTGESSTASLLPPPSSYMGIGMMAGPEAASTPQLILQLRLPFRSVLQSTKIMKSSQPFTPCTIQQLEVPVPGVWPRINPGS